MALQLLPVTEEAAPAWRDIHNHVIPVSPLSLDDVVERMTRNRLTLAYADGTLIGNATIRPPTPESPTVTVIVRVLEPFRRRGYGTEYLAAVLDEANRFGTSRIETVVLTANRDGFEFAQRRGFVECDRYRVGDAGAEYVTMVLR